MPVNYQPAQTSVDMPLGYEGGNQAQQFAVIASLLAHNREQAEKKKLAEETAAGQRALFSQFGALAQGGITPTEMGDFMGSATALGAGSEAASLFSRVEATQKQAEQQQREGRIAEFLGGLVQSLPQARQEIPYSGADFDPVGQLLRDSPDVARPALQKQYGPEVAQMVEAALLQPKTGYVYDPAFVKQAFAELVNRGASPAEAKTALGEIFGEDAFDSEEALRKEKVQEYRLSYQTLTKQGGTTVNVGQGLGGGEIPATLSEELPVKELFSKKLNVDVISALANVSPEAARRWRTYSPGFAIRVMPRFDGGRLVAQREPAPGSPDAHLLLDLNAALSKIPSASAIGDVLKSQGSSATQSQIQKGVQGGAAGTSDRGNGQGDVPPSAPPLPEFMASPELLQYLEGIRRQ